MPTTPDAPSGRPTDAPPAPRGALTASALKLGRAGHRLVLGLTVAAAALSALAVLAWSVLLFQILPRIDTWRLDLAEQATRALGVPVRIGQVVGHAEGMWPVLALREVQLLDEAGHVALHLPEVTARVSLATLSPLAISERTLRLSALELVKPELDVRRDAAGVFHVAGLKLGASSGQGGNHEAADWVLSQGLIKITQGTVRWTDEWLLAPPLALQQVDLSLRNRPGLGRRLHELTVDATPPAAFGQRFALKAAMTQPLWLASGVPVKVGEGVRWWQRWALDVTTPSQWQTWSGTVSLALPHVDVQRLKQHVNLPIDVDGGRGALTGELSLQRGVPSALKLDVAVQDVNLRLAKDLPPLAFKRLQGQLSVGHEAEKSTLSFDKLSFALSEGLVWPASSGRLVWRHAPWKAGLSDAIWGLTRGGEAQADRLDLALLAQLADRLPLAPGLRTTLADVAPHGVVEDLSWRWDGLLEAPVHYKVAGRVRGLGWAASDKASRPGMEGADVTVSADESGGRADLQLKQGFITFPGLFEDPKIPLTALQARVGWSVKPAAKQGDPADFKVDVTQASFVNADATGHLEGHWRTGAAGLLRQSTPVSRFPGWLTLNGSLDKGDATRVWRYLPMTIPKGPREYVRLALRSGVGEKVSFDIDGDLAQFPFKNDVGGRFRVKVPMHNVTLDYVPAGIQGDQPATWPAFSALEGQLLFEGQRLLIKDARGRLGTVGSGGFALRDVQGRIEDLGQHDPHLSITGHGAGPLDDMVHFLSASPVGRWTGDVLGQATSAGTATLNLSLDIPLDHADDTRLKGQVAMTESDAASLRMNPSLPMFAALQGSISFTESDLSVAARTRVWGQLVDVDGRRTADGVTRFVAQGVMSADSLRLASEFPILPRLAQRLSGEAPVTVTVTMGRADAQGGKAYPEVQVSSTLQGMAANLPAPLGKPAQALWPIKVTHRQEDAQGHSDALIVDLGNPLALQGLAVSPADVPWLHVDLRRDTTGAQARVARGAIGLVQGGASGPSPILPLPAKGVTAQIAAPTLDVDAWSAVARLFKQADRPAAAAAAAQDESESYLPDRITVKAGLLSVQQRNLKDVSATLAHPAPGVWHAQLESQQVAGQIDWVPESTPLATAPGATRVIARLTRLSVPNAEAQALEEQATEQMLTAEASALPALDIVIDQFEWRGLPLGRLEVEALNRMVPVAGGAPLPEWRLAKFRISTPEAQLNATGNWTATGTAGAQRKPGASVRSLSRSAFTFALDLQNSGNLLTRLGLPKTLKGGKGKMTGQVGWLGSPLEPDPLSMAGDINVLISEGQFLKVDPGMAKLLGVLSLQSLPRRLSLDFRDVFQQGFAFDSIDGDVKIAQGAAITRNMRMRGVQALVLLEGQADLAHETQNLHVYVIPDVNAGGASLAYAAINPIIGLGTFVAQVLFRKQVAEASTQEFRVTGPWADPQVEKLGNKPEAPDAAAIGPASAASGASATSPLTKPRKPS